jgi:ComF family protein
MSREKICLRCDASFFCDARARCLVCAISMPHYAAGNHATSPHCGACLARAPAFDATVTLADYAAPLDALALALKFGASLGIAREFGRRLAARSTASNDDDPPQLLIPVPLTPQRLAERGFNQAWEITRALAARRPVRAGAHLLRRHPRTTAQTRLSAAARRHNVRDVFFVAPGSRAPALLHGMHVGLIDDVMTSGATLDALARVVKQAGARRITNFVALRTPLG